MERISRRRFLGQASCAAVGTTALFNTVLDLKMFNALAAPGEDYRALVCLFLSGGIDSFNLLVPTSDPQYQEYATVRGDLALPQASLLPILPATSDGRAYGLHPGVVELQQLFGQQRLALVANVGTLVEPTTLAQFRNGSVALPLGLFSHSDQQMHWQSSIPDRRSPIGWAGRIADILETGNCNPNISMNISLSGMNIWQTGRVTNHYTITENGSEGLWDYGELSPGAVIRTQAVDGLLGLHYQHLFEKTFAARMRGAIDAHLDFSSAIAGVPPLATVFSNTGLSRKFRMIALTIAARQALCMKRQTFFVEVGGWDHHDEVILNQAAMLPVISRALAEFQAALVELDVVDQVTTFTASDFGRTLSSNGRGSDHAWGGNHMVMGGAVAGGDIYGSYPDLYLGNSLDTGRGRLIPTTSVDEYFADLALWFGVPEADLPLVLPNIGRFRSGSPSSRSIGFVRDVSLTQGS
ncbi:MAG TPA: DUF1501 domain-containing protein [Candidatus Polarisedimenticolaceae bacterium]|nr:DUF1501 domain-containing protein [Candidatus Polarisedimenticolaceae bacterium]